MFEDDETLQMYIEESLDHLGDIESDLLAIEEAGKDIDVDLVNNVFRAAHSIKGGSGTFGLNAVADFTHVMETLLDEMRDGKRQVTQDAVNLLLTTVDVLREMLTALRENTPLDDERIKVTHNQLEELLAAGSTGSSSTEQTTGESTESTAQNGILSETRCKT